ncbi:MAG: MotA/TolQ/ExbB proton channel family protein [Cyclobacteriaceae bacterium]|nr:MotA/TolQ/ExbB proton channel family protein [Cyclobacteriaceae bacterium]
MILGQITTTGAADTLAAASDATGSVQVIDLLFKGGIMMIPIVLLSLLAVYVFVERMRTLKQALKTPDGFMNKVKTLVANGDLNGAKLACAEVDTPVARMIEKGLNRIGHPLKNIEVSVENVGKIELYKLERNLPLLATVSGAAPMLGFLGTVTGMIQAFISIAQEEGAVSPKLLSAGIYEAMVTTAAGLVVGIIAYLGYNYLVTRLQKAVHAMEYSSIEFIDLLQEPK